MIYKIKDLSRDQRTTMESLLRESFQEDDSISVRTIASAAPGWLRNSWESAERLGLAGLSMDEIESEIEAARKARRNQRQRLQQ